MALAPIKQRYADLVAFFQWWVPTYLTGVNLYLQGQAAPRPANPYISFNPLDDVEVVGLDERRISTPTLEVLRGQRKITCRLEAYTDSTTRFSGVGNAWDMLQELRFSLGYPDVAAKLSAINCRVIDEGSISNASETLNTTNEPRASMSFVLSTVIVQTIDNGSIEIVNGTGTISDTIGDIPVTFSAIKP
jgi:hypothetical protein